MRDTFADTSAARRDLGFRSTVALDEGLAPRMGLDPGAGVRQRPGAAALAVAAGGVRARRAGHRHPDQQLRPGHLGRGPEGLREEDWEQRPPALPAGSSTASRTASTAPEARLASGRRYFKEGGYRQRHPGRGRLPRVPDPLPVAPEERLRPVPGGEAYFRQQEQPRPGPDRHQGGPRGVPAPPRPVPGLPLAEKARARISEAGRAWPGRSSWPATSTSGRARPAAPPSPATRSSSRTTPTTSGLDEVLFRLAECLQTSGPRAPRPCPTSDRLLEEYPKSALCRAGQASSWPTRPRPRPPVPLPRAPRRRPRPPRSPAASPVALPRKLKCHFRICKKAVDETILFLLASGQISGLERSGFGDGFRARPGGCQ